MEGPWHLKPGLLAWPEAPVAWALQRRRGFLYHPFGPTAAIDDSEYDASLAALAGRYRRMGVGARAFRPPHGDTGVRQPLHGLDRNVGVRNCPKASSRLGYAFLRKRS